MDIETRLAKIAELREWAQLDDTSHGEACIALCDLAEYTDYVSDGLLAAIEAEIEWHIENYSRYAEIVTQEETHVIRVRGIVWNEH